jgi:hypothetical protein
VGAKVELGGQSYFSALTQGLVASVIMAPIAIHSTFQLGTIQPTAEIYVDITSIRPAATQT